MEIVPDIIVPLLPITESSRGEGIHIGDTLAKEPRVYYNDNNISNRLMESKRKMLRIENNCVQRMCLVWRILTEKRWSFAMQQREDENIDIYQEMEGDRQEHIDMLL
eukprot:555244_1